MKQGLMLLLLICLHSVVYSTPRLSCHDLFSQVIIRSNGVIDFQAEVKRRSQERGSPSKLNSSSQKRGAKVISLLEYKKDKENKEKENIDLEVLEQPIEEVISGFVEGNYALAEAVVKTSDKTLRDKYDQSEIWNLMTRIGHALQTSDKILAGEIHLKLTEEERKALERSSSSLKSALVVTEFRRRILEEGFTLFPTKKEVKEGVLFKPRILPSMTFRSKVNQLAALDKELRGSFLVNKDKMTRFAYARAEMKQVLELALEVVIELNDHLAFLRYNPEVQESDIAGFLKQAVKVKTLLNSEVILISQESVDWKLRYPGQVEEKSELSLQLEYLDLLWPEVSRQAPHLRLVE